MINKGFCKHSQMLKREWNKPLTMVVNGTTIYYNKEWAKNNIYSIHNSTIPKTIPNYPQQMSTT
jgi:hypothetical protein